MGNKTVGSQFFLGFRRNFLSGGSKQPPHFPYLNGPEGHHLADRHAKGNACKTPMRRKRNAGTNEAQRTVNDRDWQRIDALQADNDLKGSDYPDTDEAVIS